MNKTQKGYKVTGRKKEFLKHTLVGEKKTWLGGR